MHYQLVNYLKMHYLLLDYLKVHYMLLDYLKMLVTYRLVVYLLVDSG